MSMNYVSAELGRTLDHMRSTLLDNLYEAYGTKEPFEDEPAPVLLAKYINLTKAESEGLRSQVDRVTTDQENSLRQLENAHIGRTHDILNEILDLMKIEGEIPSNLTAKMDSVRACVAELVLKADKANAKPAEEDKVDGKSYGLLHDILNEIIETIKPTQPFAHTVEGKRNLITQTLTLLMNEVDVCKKFATDIHDHVDPDHYQPVNDKEFPSYKLTRVYEQLSSGKKIVYDAKRIQDVRTALEAIIRRTGGDLDNQERLVDLAGRAKDLVDRAVREKSAANRALTKQTDDSLNGTHKVYDQFLDILGIDGERTSNTELKLDVITDALKTIRGRSDALYVRVFGEYVGTRSVTQTLKKMDDALARTKVVKNSGELSVIRDGLDRIMTVCDGRVVNNPLADYVLEVVKTVEQKHSGPDTSTVFEREAYETLDGILAVLGIDETADPDSLTDKGNQIVKAIEKMKQKLSGVEDCEADDEIARYASNLYIHAFGSAADDTNLTPLEKLAVIDKALAERVLTFSEPATANETANDEVLDDILKTLGHDYDGTQSVETKIEIIRGVVRALKANEVTLREHDAKMRDELYGHKGYVDAIVVKVYGKENDIPETFTTLNKLEKIQKDIHCGRKRVLDLDDLLRVDRSLTSILKRVGGDTSGLRGDTIDLAAYTERFVHSALDVGDSGVLEDRKDAGSVFPIEVMRTIHNNLEEIIRQHGEDTHPDETTAHISERALTLVRKGKAFDDSDMVDIRGALSEIVTTCDGEVDPEETTRNLSQKAMVLVQRLYASSQTNTK